MFKAQLLVVVDSYFLFFSGGGDTDRSLFGEDGEAAIMVCYSPSGFYMFEVYESQGLQVWGLMLRVKVREAR